VKGNIILGPWGKTELFLNAATGFHSNDARAVVSNPDTKTLPQAVSYEVGVRSQAFDRLDLSLAMWLLNLESELVFAGDSGDTEAKGRSRRYGMEAAARWHLTDWFSLTGDLTLSKAYFTATGEAVPRAPKFTARADATVRLPFGLESSLEMRHVGTRWLVEDRSWEARGATVFDWTTRFRSNKGHFRHLEIFFSVENVFDVDYREAQFLTETQLVGEPDPVTDVHFTPGKPRTFLAGVKAYF
jgi:outer membrane receptor protein involved in Fe transport